MPPTIRLAALDDAEQIQAIYAPYCRTPISFETEPPSVEEMRGRLAKVLEQYPWLVCEDGDEILGYAFAGRHRERAAYRWSVDTSIYIRQGRQRRGLGRALYTSLLAVLPLQGYVNAYAGATLPNPASVGLHEIKETGMIELSEEQRKAIDEGQAVRVQEKGREYVLLRPDVYDHRLAEENYDASPWDVEELDRLREETVDLLDRYGKDA
jgi:L-amino acid N-acyltransferase YncA